MINDKLNSVKKFAINHKVLMLLILLQWTDMYWTGGVFLHRRIYNGNFVHQIRHFLLDTASLRGDSCHAGGTGCFYSHPAA